MDKSRHTYEWVMSHIWIACDMTSHMNESHHTRWWVMSRIWVSHVTHMSESCRTYEWAMSHIWVSHVAVMCESCRKIQGTSIRRCLWRRRRLIPTGMCDTYIYEVRIHTRNMTQSYVRYDLLIGRYDSRLEESCRMREWVMSHIWMSHVAHMSESCRTYEWVMSHIWVSHVALMTHT